MGLSAEARAALAGLGRSAIVAESSSHIGAGWRGEARIGHAGLSLASAGTLPREVLIAGRTELDTAPPALDLVASVR